MKKLSFLILAISFLFGACKEDPITPSGGEGGTQLNANQKEVHDLVMQNIPIKALPERTEKREVERIEGTPRMVGAPLSESNYKYEARPIKVIKECDIVNTPEEFALLAPWADIFPGALIQGKTLQDGVPALIPIYEKRREGRIYFSFVNGDKDRKEWYKEIVMRGSEVNKAMNELLQQHSASHPAKTQYQIEVVNSLEELAAKFDLSLKYNKAKLKSKLKSNWSENKTYMAVRLNQIFYTVVYDDPDGGIAGVFTDDIQKTDLEPYTAPNNPICYVSSVSYGRSFILLYESESSQDSLYVSLKAAFGKDEDNSAFAEVLSRKVLKRCNVKLMQIGGNPGAGLEAAMGDYDKIKKFLIEGAQTSPNNPGAPLSYKIKHLKDNSVVRLSDFLHYKVAEQMFPAVKPNNDLCLDLYRLSINVSSKDGWEISEPSSCQVSGLRVGYINVQTGIEYFDYPPIDFSYNSIRAKSILPIYHPYFEKDFNKENRLILEMDVHLSATCRRKKWWGAKEERMIVAEKRKLRVEYEFDEGTNQWVIQETNFHLPDEAQKDIEPSPFRMLKYEENINGVNVEIVLDTRLRFNGYNYPIEY